MDLEKSLEIAQSATTIPGFVDTLKDPFKILVSTILSARTKDETTSRVCKELFKKIQNFDDLRKIDEGELAESLKPIGFYKTKAKHLKKLAEMINKVPNTLEDLLELPGVGRKTANLVISVAFQKPGICVDTHVHRIMNRWGVVNTETPFETEMELRKKVPKRLWSKINSVLVPFGKEICNPTSPKCTLCPLNRNCLQIGVKKHR